MADTKVTRISAKDGTAKKPATKGKAVKAKTVKKPKASRPAPKNPLLKALYSFGGYFKGAWIELRQVRWPTRRATWELTLAVILFSVFFAGVILLLDLLFKSLFELILR